MSCWRKAGSEGLFQPVFFPSEKPPFSVLLCVHEVWDGFLLCRRASEFALFIQGVRYAHAHANTNATCVDKAQGGKHCL